MTWFVILACIFGPLFALVAYSHNRLRRALLDRHPGAMRTIDSMTRSLPRGQRAVERHRRYEMLQDDEIDRHLRNATRAQYLFLYVWLVFAVLLVVLFAITVARGSPIR